MQKANRIAFLGFIEALSPIFLYALPNWENEGKNYENTLRKFLFLHVANYSGFHTLDKLWCSGEFYKLYIYTIGPFAGCHQALEPEAYYETCIYDMCASPGNTSLCNNLGTYARACQERGGNLQDWRPLLCRKSEANSSDFGHVLIWC